MFSVLVASLFLPFLPLLPIHILVQNLLCDLSQIGMPFDSVDKEYLQKPRKWETKSISRFMFVLGPLSSFFDIACFCILYWIIGASDNAGLFQTGWFLFGTISQVLILHMIRTRKLPFLESRAGMPLLLSTLVFAAVAVVIAFVGSIGKSLDFTALPITFIPWLILLLAAYSVAAQVIKNIYVRKFGDWL